MSDDPYEYLRSIIGDPVQEIAQVIHDEMQTAPDAEPSFLELGAAHAVFDWHRSRVLDHEHVQTAAQDWYDRNHRAVLPDWAGLYQILSGDRMEP